MNSYTLNDNVICPTEVSVNISETLEDYNINDYSNIPSEIIEFNIEDELKLGKILVKNENDYYIRYKFLGDKKNMTVYSFFHVYTPYDIDVIYLSENSSDQRVYLNGVFQFVCDYRSRKIYQMHLKAGNNDFCIEHPYANSSSYFSIRIEKLDYNDCKTNSLVSNNYWYEEGNIRIEYDYTRETNILEFILFPEDMVNLTTDTEIQMVITEKEKNDILLESKCVFFQKYIFDLSVIPYCDEDKYNSLWVRFKVYSHICNINEVAIPIFRLETSRNYTKYIIEQSQNLLSKPEIPYIIKSTIEYYLKLIQCVQSDTYYGSYLKEILDAESSGRVNDLIYKTGSHKFYYHSDIDNSYYPFVVTLPTNYNPNTFYPLLIILSVVDVEGLSSYLRNRSDIITVEIGGRGVTMGSYVGEISFFEAFDEIKRIYRIDETRVFLSGYSNGAGASFMLSQNYPHMFSGIYPCSGSVSKKKIVNLKNNRVRYLTSEADDFHKTTAVEGSDCLNTHVLDYKLYQVEKLIHSQMLLSQYTKPVIDELINTKTNPYPNEIEFYTDKNRHLESYWIRIHSIQYGELYAKAFAKITNNQIIVQLDNCSGVTISIPPQIDICSFKVTINDKQFLFENYEKKEIIFVYTKDGYIISCNEKKATPIYKGNGLLDVYARPMRIINATREDEDQWIEVAKNFSEPKCNGFIKNLNVNYPICNLKKFSDEVLQKSLLILDDGIYQNNFLQKIRDVAMIKTDMKGYKYLDKYIYGDYCIMQVLENPWNKKESIVLVSCNNYELLRKNLFTRKLIIPTCLHGLHPYLNISALIFDGEYKGIIDYGMNIAKIDNIIQKYKIYVN